MPTRRDWTRDELVVAFNLYCRIPFGRIHNRNPEILDLAKQIGRSPSAVSWKLANFARLDPTVRARNRSGATHGSISEQAIWEEFNGNWSELAYESERLLLALKVSSSVELEHSFPAGETRLALVKTRVNQAFFRSAVLASYDQACCITKLNIPALLNASHIVPWIIDERNRTNPSNGLCLNALHDRAFDCGLITITPEYLVRVSTRLNSKKFTKSIKFISQHDGMKITLPSRFKPDPLFLKYHNENVFREK